jgi:hypothetical protein
MSPRSRTPSTAEVGDAIVNGRGRYSLWTGDVGTALFAAACLDVDARYPILEIV